MRKVELNRVDRYFKDIMILEKFEIHVLFNAPLTKVRREILAVRGIIYEHFLEST